MADETGAEDWGDDAMTLEGSNVVADVDDLAVLNEGTWMVTSLVQHIATFFLPLPDPLGFPAGQAFPTYLPLTYETGKLLQQRDIELAHQSFDRRDIVVLADSSEVYGERAHDKVNFSNKCTLSSSILIHQVETDLMRRTGLDAAITAADAASSGYFDASDRSLTSRYTLPSPYMEGAGRVTVVEVAVPLRILGSIPELNYFHIPTSTVQRELPPYPDAWDFVGEPESAADLDDVLLRTQRALDVAISDVRSLQKAYRANTGRPVTLLTRERLPFIVPITARRLADIGRGSDSAYRAGIEVSSTGRFMANLSVLTRDQMEAVNRLRLNADNGAFRSYIDLAREGEDALYGQGDTRLGVLLSALAAESLLNDLLLHLKWEEGKTPEDASKEWVDGFDSRVKKELPPRLGGNWDFSGSGPVGRWNREGLAVRHRVVHGAYEPTKVEAQAACESVNELVTFLCDRLTNQEQLRKYPRTALALIGEEGIRQRGRYSRRIRALQDDLSEPRWDITFLRWRDAHNRRRRDVIAGPRQPQMTNAYLIAVLYSDRSYRWILHDRETFLAAKVEISDGDLTEGQRAGLNEFLSGPQPTAPEAMSFALVDFDTSLLSVQGSWREEYHFVPMAEVMVDRSDRSR